MTEQATQTNQTATGQTAQSAQATDAAQSTNTGITAGSTATTGSTTGTTTDTTTTTGQPAQATNTGTTSTTTSSTTTDQPAQATETTSFVPDWQAKSDKLKEAVQQGYGVQVVYKSTNEEPCEPTLITEKQASDNYPFVVKEPVGFVAPKYLWNGTTRGWIETASIQQGKDLATAQNNIVKLQQQVTELGATAGQVNTVNKQVQADEAEFANAITALKQNSQENSSAIQVQLGHLITIVSSLVATNKSETSTTAQNTASQPAASTATTTTSAESTQPTTAQTTKA